MKHQIVCALKDKVKQYKILSNATFLMYFLIHIPAYFVKVDIEYISTRWQLKDMFCSIRRLNKAMPFAYHTTITRFHRGPN